jgi:phospholipase/lecithinase/hemolysin
MFSAIYVIGDSLSDTGRTASVVPPEYVPSAVNGRMCNGPLWVEYLAPKLGLTYNSLDNFSWAGANTGYINVFPGLPGMKNQLEELLANLGPNERLDKDALYVVFGAANDFFLILANIAPASAVMPPAAVNVRTIVETLHAYGARNIVVVDLPDIGLTPRARFAGRSAECTAASVWYNTLLADELAKLDFPVIRVSSFSLLQSIVSSPGEYGFTNVTDLGIFNIPASGTYLFWDDIHPTTLTQYLLANTIYDALRAVPRLKNR